MARVHSHAAQQDHAHRRYVEAERAEDIAPLLTREQGKPLLAARGGGGGGGRHYRLVVARIAVYFVPNTNQGFADAISQAVHDAANKPSAISISWGSPESGWTGQAIAAMCAAFADAATLGVTVTAASGDSLATDGVKDGKAHVDYPPSDPRVLGCGGTKVAASGATLTGETVWNSNGGGTGGGVSALFARPAYQRGLTLPKRSGRKGGRGVHDVAGNADPDSGYRIVLAGKVGIVGGTSAVAPLWAAIAAVLNAGRPQTLGEPYAATGDFHDVTQGDNMVDTIGYSAAPGWDRAPARLARRRGVAGGTE